MGGYTPKLASSRLGVAQRESGLAFRDKLNHQEREVQHCNRLGCSTRLTCSKSQQVRTSDRTKYSKPSFRSTSGKSMTGSSSKTHSSLCSSKKHHEEPDNLCSYKKEVSSDTKYIQIQTEVSESITPATRIPRKVPETNDVESGVLKALSVNLSEEVEGHSVRSNKKTWSQVEERSGVGNQDTSFRSSKVSSVTKVSQAAKSVPLSRVGIRKLGCTSISDVLPSGCSSSSHLSRSRRNEAAKKRSNGDCSASGIINRESYASGNVSGECSSSGDCTASVIKSTEGSSSRNVGRESSSKGKCSATAKSLTGRRSSTRGYLSSPKLSHFDQSAQQASKRTRKQSLSRDAVASVRTQTTNRDTGARTNRHERGNRTLLTEPLSTLPRSRRSEMSAGVSHQPTSLQLSPAVQANSYSRPGGNRETVHNRLTSDNTQRFHDLSSDQDDFLLFDTEGIAHGMTSGIAEVLSALEWIDQDEELTNEELLDLEERMGTVSTALTDEALSKCLESSFYKPVCSDARSISSVDSDVKCSICQEEYVEGDVVGKLGCDHGYHMACIHQWLQQKNWCPVCKGQAAPS
ncbi:hypothetical protein IFM89_028808 [Coptis chinensis]|uniref:RING-type E3 ubiquitin transferase n=1 Tax=Coptis chinensis TaxID=261450 RepID=A0A835IGJ7_9MAGN|nr:hypothetical protein IFM89_028808 [Coptis chinensis]